ncbi:hypothetical protein Tco_0681330 [Tanacetum coccineum]|uniref:Uncharacterized protein n=1 Tax=Tanacetum coccineum TaxID=301880 RepID=A0ABQ4XPM5_9ASTR
MINYTEGEVTCQLVNVLCQVGFTTLSAMFLILEILVDRDVPIVVGRGFLDTIGGNIDIPNMTFTTFDGLTLPLKEPYDHEARSSRAKRSRNVETVEEALLPDVHHEFLEWRGCSREAKSRCNSRLVTLLPKLIYSLQIVDWQLLHKIGCGDEIDQMLKISLNEAQSEEEIFFSVAWVRAFNTREPIYPELCREFYATYKFDKSLLGNSDYIMLRRQYIAEYSSLLQRFRQDYSKRVDRLEDRLIPDIPVDDIQRVAAQRAPRFQRASMQEIYERMGSMEIRQEAIERMEMLTTHLVMLGPSTTSTTSSTIPSSHHSSSMMMMRMSRKGGEKDDYKQELWRIRNAKVYFTFPIYLFSIIFRIRDNAHIKYGGDNLEK